MKRDVLIHAAEARRLVSVNLREKRKQAGLSQEALAAASQLHRTELSLIERGERDPRVSTLVRIAHGLGIEPCELLGGELADS
jgi:transcriptional regulator with XRE-family HTH domain